MKADCMIKIIRNYYGILLLSSLAVVLLFGSLNQQLFIILNSICPNIPIYIIKFFNYVASPSKFILAVALLVSTLYFSKNNIYKVLASIVTYYVLFTILKNTVHEARPFIELAGTQYYLIKDGPYLNNVDYQSFPSGHAGIVALFSFTLINLYFSNNKFLQVICVLFIVVVCLLRVISGWHWPLDVICGAILGYSIAKIFFCKNKCIFK